MRFDPHNPEDEGHVRQIRAGAMLRRLLPLFGPHRARLAAGVGLMLLALAADLAGPLILRRLIDVDIRGGSTRGILAGAGLFVVLFLAARAAAFAEVVILARVGLDIVTALKRRTFDHILTLSLDYFDRNPPGRLMARVESDCERLLALFSEAGVAIVSTVLLLLGTLGLMFATDARIAAGVTLLLLPVAVVNLFVVAWLRRYYAASRKSYAKVSAFVSEYVQAVPVVQVFSLEETANARMAKVNEERLKAEMRAAFREYPFWGAVSAAEVAIVMAILFVGSKAVFGATMSVGTLVLFVEYARRIFWPVAQLTEQLNFVQRAFASADRVFGILDTSSRTPDRSDALDVVPRDWRELSFEKVVFEYDSPGRAGEGARADPQTGGDDGPGRADGARGPEATPRHGPRALDGVSFSVRRGERLALVGVSGGGKTTIASLLMRFYDPSAGRIALDGVDIRAFKKRAWRRAVGLVLQDIQLFPGTLEENLRALSEDVPHEAIERALDIVEAREVVERLPRGLETELAENGANLSLGERQLVSFARAVLRDPEILVLDEATSSVDPATERRLQRSLEKMLVERTAIIIAHRLETVRRADRILVLHAGRVVEEGTHEALYARGGLYKDLCDLQLGGEAGTSTSPTTSGRVAGEPEQDLAEVAS